MVITTIIVILLLLKRRKRKGSNHSDLTRISYVDNNDEEAYYFSIDQDMWYIPYEEFKFCQKIGGGAYGTVVAVSLCDN